MKSTLFQFKNHSKGKGTNKNGSRYWARTSDPYHVKVVPLSLADQKAAEVGLHSPIAEFIPLADHLGAGVAGSKPHCDCGRRGSNPLPLTNNADIAQLVEQLLHEQKASGSNPGVGTNKTTQGLWAFGHLSPFRLVGIFELANTRGDALWKL